MIKSYLKATQTEAAALSETAGLLSCQHLKVIITSVTCEKCRVSELLLIDVVSFQHGAYFRATVFSLLWKQLTSTKRSAKGEQDQRLDKTRVELIDKLHWEIHAGVAPAYLLSAC